MADEHRPHFFLSNTKTEFKYKSTNTVPIGRIYPDRSTRGSYLQQKISQVKNELETIRNQNPNIVSRGGDYLEFTADKDLYSADSFENVKAGIKLLNLKRDTYESDFKVTVYVPENSSNFFEERINSYCTENTEKGNPKFQDSISTIKDIAVAKLTNLWLDDIEFLPKSEKKWCEVWFCIESDTEINLIKEKINRIGVSYREKTISFPEKVVILCKVNEFDLMKMINEIGYISEIHLFWEPASFYTKDNSIIDNKQWCENLLQRIEDKENRSRLCILDTGIAYNHPLLKGVINQNDIQVEDIRRNISDIDGHGSEMAGLCEYFDLQKCLESDAKIERKIQLESVKILQQKDDEGNNPDLSGSITENAVNMAQASYNSDNRVHCMAVTAEICKNGEPSSWSGKLDDIIAGKEDGKKKLFIVSAGNDCINDISGETYPNILFKNSVQSPAQAWNALTVGAISTKINIKDQQLAKFKPVAPINELCPFTTTSNEWSNKWPVKPEVLFEGGNGFTDGHFVDSCPDLSLLTTSNTPITKPFSTINATSSATAQAANVAAEINYLYPNYWPETTRALIVHSAEYPKKIWEKYREKSKTERRELLRCYGYGVGNKNKAISCSKNKAVLIIEDSIQPYAKQKKGYISSNVMNLHKLPWPKEFLTSLGEEKVRVKITLSYFVEAAPDEKGWLDKYRYQSAGLVFDMQHPAEMNGDFVARVNKALRDENYSSDNSSQKNNWFFGSNQRDSGSIHSDYWVGRAVDLADCENIAVYPITGWWKTRKKLGKFNNTLRYALIVSLETEHPDFEVYNAVKTIIETQIQTVVATAI